MRQFADLAGISTRTCLRSSGLRAPSEHVLDGIANALKVSAETLYEQAGWRRRARGSRHRGARCDRRTRG